MGRAAGERARLPRVPGAPPNPAPGRAPAGGEAAPREPGHRLHPPLSGRALRRSDRGRDVDRSQRGQVQTGTRTEARQAAERLAKALEEAWNQGRYSGLEQTVAEDVVFSNPSGKTSQGRDEMVATMKKDRQAFGDSNTQFKVTRVDEISPGVVLADITHRFSEPLRLPNGTSGDHTQIMAVLNREGDHLKARSFRVFMPMPMGEPAVGGAGEEGKPQEEPRDQAPVAPDPSMQPQDGQ